MIMAGGQHLSTRIRLAIDINTWRATDLDPSKAHTGADLNNPVSTLSPEFLDASWGSSLEFGWLPETVLVTTGSPVPSRCVSHARLNIYGRTIQHLDKGS
ncbi:unnamed protein product, partial [Mycena citricolor]